MLVIIHLLYHTNYMRELSNKILYLSDPKIQPQCNKHHISITPCPNFHLVCHEKIKLQFFINLKIISLGYHLHTFYLNRT